MADFAQNWVCPHCSMRQTGTNADFDDKSSTFYMTKSALGYIGIKSIAACCANPDCMMPTVHVTLGQMGSNGGNRYFVEDGTIVSKRLFPDSNAKVFPEYIPLPLREDYVEACKIRTLSPKASATLARRCLQGMIRDFCGISKPTLFKEIAELKDLADNGNAPTGVSIDSVEAIDHIRQIGNIGAHMEKDINVIVDVEPDEAQVLIELIETLFDEWYVERQKRKDRFARVKEIADEKAAQKKS